MNFLNFGLSEILMIVWIVLPFIAAYFVIKLAVKNAVRELKREGTL